MKAGTFTPAWVTQSVRQYKQYQFKCNVFWLKKWYELVQLIKRSAVLCSKYQIRQNHQIMFFCSFYIPDICVWHHPLWQDEGLPWCFIVRGVQPRRVSHLNVQDLNMILSLPLYFPIHCGTFVSELIYMATPRLNVYFAVSQTGSEHHAPLKITTKLKWFQLWSRLPLIFRSRTSEITAVWSTGKQVR